jgi:hypothetical protein
MRRTTTARRQDSALDRAKQNALQGRRIDIMKIGDFSRAIDQHIAAGWTQEAAIEAAVRNYTEPADAR